MVSTGVKLKWPGMGLRTRSENKEEKKSTFELFCKKLQIVDPEHCFGYYRPEQPFCRLSFWTSFLQLIVLEHSSFDKMSYQQNFLQ